MASMLDHGATIFLGAFLLFSIQLLLAKAMLPWFGGAAAVWTVSVLFFQTALLAGYGYAHWTARRATLAAQRNLHLAALVTALLALAAGAVLWKTPLLPDSGWRPSPEAAPAWQILATLGVSVGLPFMVLAATAPLLQAWWSAAHPDRTPYRLYAVSNLGSLLGLVCYPFLLEVFLPLNAQAWIWLAGFALFALGLTYVALRLRASSPAPALAASTSGDDHATEPRARHTALWFALPACAATLMLAVTNQLSQEIAAIPLLWMLPLGLYLVSFILCFDSARWYWRRIYALLLVPAAGLVTLAWQSGPQGPVPGQIGLYSFALFVTCMVCHGELARLKPAPRQLTAFYLTLTAGGAAGGLFVGLAAPQLFAGFYELPLALWACSVFAAIAGWQELRTVRRTWLLPVAAACLLAAIWLAVTAGLRDPTLEAPTPAALARSPLVLGAAAALAALVALFALRRHWPRRLPAAEIVTLTLAFILFGATQLAIAAQHAAGRLLAVRNFYGVLQVKRDDSDIANGPAIELYHGHILHGLQYRAERLRREPTTYYGRHSGAGLALLHHPRRAADQPLRLGVVGLGTGTLAAYGRPGDVARFYEIDPNVIRLAAGVDAPFSYLRDSHARIEVIAGDARLSLAHELARGERQAFDVLVLDAFSGESVPVHLLTREAMALYLEHLAPGGIVAIHVSSRYLDLGRVIVAVAQHFRLARAVIVSEDTDIEWRSFWVLLARDVQTLGVPAILRASIPETSATGVLWRDDFSNVLPVLRLGAAE